MPSMRSTVSMVMGDFSFRACASARPGDLALRGGRDDIFELHLELVAKTRPAFGELGPLRLRPSASAILAWAMAAIASLQVARRGLHGHSCVRPRNPLRTRLHRQEERRGDHPSRLILQQKTAIPARMLCCRSRQSGAFLARDLRYGRVLRITPVNRLQHERHLPAAVKLPIPYIVQRGRQIRVPAHSGPPMRRQTIDACANASFSSSLKRRRSYGKIW